MYSFQHVPRHLFVIKPGVSCFPELGQWQSLHRYLVSVHTSRYELGYSPGAAGPLPLRASSPCPQPALRGDWPPPSCNSLAKCTCSARCRASLLSNSTFLSVAGGPSADQAAVVLLTLLTDWRSWLYIQPFRGIRGICSGKGLWLGWLPSMWFPFDSWCLGRLTPWHQQMIHVLEIHPGPSIFDSWWSKEKIITGPKNSNSEMVFINGGPCRWL